MDLAGLLLDEEGTFSLTGFQDFTVRATVRLSLAPPPPQAGSRDSGRYPLEPRGRGALLFAIPGFGWLLRAMPTRGPGHLGLEANP